MSGTRRHERQHDRAGEPNREPARTHADVLRAVASNTGNAAFARFAEPGSGILPGGRVHPDVESAIATARGHGRALDGPVRERVGEALDDPLTDVRVHADDRADALARSVSARAFTTGADIFFAHGEYRPRTASGDALLAHELTHVVQQRGSPVTGPLTVTDSGGALETEAEAMARELGDG
jgi:Domain of unknown function (DUF4157)